ncbi:MAG: polysaccharide biosynthesis/export family protein [Saprospiraceae bacterium]|nr:polysaccharide biosynthesis/export family protein [Saprospiraceae bacterium]
MIKTLIFNISSVCFLLFGLSSCIQHKTLVNFTEGDRFPESMRPLTVLKIQPDDLLQIQVANSIDINPATVQPFNPEINSSKAYYGVPSSIYRVDETGFITFPGVGQLHVAGWSVTETRDSLSERLKAYLHDPIVSIRLINFKITVLGEVRNPNTFTIDGQRLNVLEALGMAGDLTNYGRRDQILVIRENAGKRSYGNINLKSKDMLDSPFYQLQQNDIVYVAPIKQKTGAVSDQSAKVLPWISIGSVILNILIFIAR